MKISAYNSNLFQDKYNNKKRINFANKKSLNLNYVKKQDNFYVELIKRAFGLSNLLDAAQETGKTLPEVEKKYKKLSHRILTIADNLEKLDSMNTN